MGKGGAPTKITKAAIEKVKKALLLGATYKIAAQYAGISERTFYEHKKNNPHFLQAVESTESENAMLHLQRLETAAADGDITTSKYIMERRHGFSQKIELDAKIGVMEDLQKKADEWVEKRKG